ncbi:hypothetical protein ACHAWF_012168 [Thalassiosira exigua]
MTVQEKNRWRKTAPALAGLCLLTCAPLAARAEEPEHLTASYSSYFEAPTCYQVGSSCRTDDFLLAGVGSFESNAPNTVDNCTDNSLAVYEEDEYIERIVVRAKDGGKMTAGTWLQVLVTVRVAEDVSGRNKTDAKETAHVYYASETYVGSSPVGINETHHFQDAHWKQICTRTVDPGSSSDPDASPFAVLSCDFQIPSGNFESDCGWFCGLQALRVNYGYGEDVEEACTATPLWGQPYSDVDDLVFRISPDPDPKPSAAPSQSSAPTDSPAPTLAPSKAPPSPEPTPLPPADFRYVCATNLTNARSGCLDLPSCPTGTECEVGMTCLPIHCAECDFQCASTPTSSPARDDALSTESPTFWVENYDRPRFNGAPDGGNGAWCAACAFHGILWSLLFLIM